MWGRHTPSEKIFLYAAFLTVNLFHIHIHVFSHSNTFQFLSCCWETVFMQDFATGSWVRLQVSTFIELGDFTDSSGWGYTQVFLLSVRHQVISYYPFYPSIHLCVLYWIWEQLALSYIVPGLSGTQIGTIAAAWQHDPFTHLTDRPINRKGVTVSCCPNAPVPLPLKHFFVIWGGETRHIIIYCLSDLSQVV